MSEKPLVSCTVVSYNSAKTILETLESVKNQTYQNIELIISDDCSTDNTLELCEEWIKHNIQRFARIKLIKADKNTGVSENGNRALAECRGIWQKGIAADDILLPNCIDDFVSFASTHLEARWISSYVRKYNETFEDKNCKARNVAPPLSFFNLPVDQQLKKIAISNFIFAPSLFFDCSLKKEIGGYNKTYSFEDYPLYIKLLENGNKCFFMEKETVCYRVHESISQSNCHLFNYQLKKEVYQFREDCCFKYLTKRQIRGQKMIWKLQCLFEKLNMNKKNTFYGLLYYKMLTAICYIFNC